MATEQQDHQSFEPNEHSPATFPSPTPDPHGSVLKGVLLNIGINVFICLIWLPLCSLGDGGSSGGDDLANVLGIIFFFGMMYIGIAQAIHVIPLGIYFAVKQQVKTNKGMLTSACVTLVIWGITFLIIMNS